MFSSGMADAVEQTDHQLPSFQDHVELQIKNNTVKLLCCFLAPSDEIITARPGDAVTLVCVGPMNVSIKALEWIKRGQVTTIRSLLHCGEDQPVEESFEGRVELMDPKLRDSNFSVIIKNVTINDSGTYECHIFNGTVPDFSIKYSSYGTRPINHTHSVPMLTNPCLT